MKRTEFNLNSVPQAQPKASCFLVVHPSHNCEISGMSWGNIFRFGSNVHMQSRLHWFDFSWVKSHCGLLSALFCTLLCDNSLCPKSQKSTSLHHKFLYKKNNDTVLWLLFNVKTQEHKGENVTVFHIWSDAELVKLCWLFGSSVLLLKHEHVWGIHVLESEACLQQHCTHHKLTGFADIELRVVVVAPCDELSISPLFCNNKSLSKENMFLTGNFSLEFFNVNTMINFTLLAFCLTPLKFLPHITYYMNLDRHVCKLQRDWLVEVHNPSFHAHSLFLSSDCKVWVLSNSRQTTASLSVLEQVWILACLQRSNSYLKSKMFSWRGGQTVSGHISPPLWFLLVVTHLCNNSHCSFRTEQGSIFVFCSSSSFFKQDGVCFSSSSSYQNIAGCCLVMLLYKAASCTSYNNIPSHWYQVNKELLRASK